MHLSRLIRGPRRRRRGSESNTRNKGSSGGDSTHIPIHLPCPKGFAPGGLPPFHPKHQIPHSREEGKKQKRCQCPLDVKKEPKGSKALGGIVLFFFLSLTRQTEHYRLSHELPGYCARRRQRRFTPRRCTPHPNRHELHLSRGVLGREIVRRPKRRLVGHTHAHTLSDPTFVCVLPFFRSGRGVPSKPFVCAQRLT